MAASGSRSFSRHKERFSIHRSFTSFCHVATRCCYNFSVNCPLPPLLTKHPPPLHPLLLPKKLHNLIRHPLRPANIAHRPVPTPSTPLPPIQSSYQISLPHPPSPRPIRQLAVLDLLASIVPRRPCQENRQRHVQRLSCCADEVH